METITDKLQYLKGTKEAIKGALVDKGVDMNGDIPFRDYANKIGEIKTGSSGIESILSEMGYGDEDIEKTLDIFNYDLALTQAYDGSQEYFRKNLRVSYIGKIDTSSLTSMDYSFSECFGLKYICPFDMSNVISAERMFSGCYGLEYLPPLNTINVRNFKYAFNNCESLKRIELLRFDSVYYLPSPFNFTTDKLTYIYIEGLGKGEKIEGDTGNNPLFNLENLINWGGGDENSRMSVVNSLLHNSFDRHSNGLINAVIRISSKTKSILTDIEIAGISAKGYTIA